MELKDKIECTAPCSLICYTCPSYRKGIVCKTATDLVRQLRGTREFYEEKIPTFVEDYKNFETVLCAFMNASCHGCRSSKMSNCNVKGCFIPKCAKGQGVNFCGECGLFPCRRAKEELDGKEYERWLEDNKYIKIHGFEQFWDSNSTKPYYRQYKK